ncbi:MAG: hypothetical protein OIF48_13240 [Silicimonas sp.]|nr:hypothetical protein [Silicimonas sp.]
MTDDPFRVLSSETGTLRVFSTDLEPEGAAAITASNVEKLLGENITLDAAKVEIFPAKVIQAMGLSAFLAEGHGIDLADLKGRAAALDALTNQIILIPASAFQGRATTLAPNPALRFIGLFREPARTPPHSMAKPETAKGALGSPPSDAAGLRHRKGSWIIALGALIIALTLVLFVAF